MCRDSIDANLGSLYARVAGTNHPLNGMPTNAALFPQAVDPSTQPANMSFGQFGATGDTYGVLAHEGTHQFEHRMMEGDAQSFLQRPIWLIEGLAVLIGDGHQVKGRGRSRKLEIGIPRPLLVEAGLLPRR